MQAYGFCYRSWVMGFWPTRIVGGGKYKPLSSSIMRRQGATFCRVSRKTVSKPTVTSDGMIILVEGEASGFTDSKSGRTTWSCTKIGDTFTEMYYAPATNRSGVVVFWTFIQNQIIVKEVTPGVYQWQAYTGRRDYPVSGGPDPLRPDLQSMSIAAGFRLWQTKTPTEIYTPLEYGTQQYGDFYPDASVILTEFNHASIFGSFYDFNITRWTQEAYTRAAMALPKVDSNAMANALEIISLCNSVLRGNVTGALSSGKKVGDMADAWLGYRYAYSTTKLDVEEYSKYLDRITSLSTGLANRKITSRGVYTHNGWTYRCTLVMRALDLLPKELGSAIEQLGFKLSAANAWDMVPYSFIVDWFLPIGDIITAFESRKEAMTYKPVQCWFSVESPGGRHYLRTPGSWQQSLPVFDTNEVSDKTKWFRIADSISLLK